MDDLISRLSELRSQYNLFDENEHGAYHTLSEAIKAINALEQPEKVDTPTVDIPTVDIPNCEDAVSRQAAIEAIKTSCFLVDAMEKVIKLPSAQPETHDKRTETHACDLIERQAAIDMFQSLANDDWNQRVTTTWANAYSEAVDFIEELPSAQPEQRTCVNCGRTVNNGGWYADGRTRCPIEEHYALPKDGYCHLWEKRNVTDDDYPERREE